MTVTKIKKVPRTTTSASRAGPGDYVKIGNTWEQIVSNTAYDKQLLPRNWHVTTAAGTVVDMWGARAYAKKEDMRDE